MKMKMKKYPILVSTIISCLIIIVSLFILGFCGMKFGVSLGGGEQIEVKMKNDTTKASYISKIETILDKYNYSIDASFVEDKYAGGEENGTFVKKSLVVQIANVFTDEQRDEIKASIASTLGVNAEEIFMGKIVNSVATKTAVRLGIAFAIIAVGFFVFAILRYDVFAALSFIVAYLHNIILYFAVVIITRIQFTIDALAVIVLLSLAISVVLISIYENFRESSRQLTAEKTPIQERMMQSEKSTILPFISICVAVLILAVGLLFVPAVRVKLVALNCVIALVVSIYTSLIIGPSTYVATLEIREMNRKAVLSRNDTVNKEIKKKVKKNTKTQNN